MKKDLHPANYRPVVFQDINNDKTFIAKSTANTKDSTKVDGIEYPLVKVHISSASHPFFTGQERLVDVEGRVDKFKARAAAAKAKSDEMKKRAQKKQSKSTSEPDQKQKIGDSKAAKK